jgi:hypothetical protein
MGAMLSQRPLASGAVGLLGLAASLGFAPSARATQSMTIDTKTTIGASLLPLDVLTIEPTGVLNVEPLRNKGKGKGVLRIAANKIIIKAGGVISATGAGDIGVNGADGSAAAPNGGGKHPTTAGQPGGGGGYFGLGASGASDTCTPLATAAGGVAFAMPTTLLPVLGSAGGAANVTATASAGGDGGGVILIEAADLQLDGAIESKGASPPAVSGVARGGGSGGFISIVAAHLTGMGTISVAGGDGTAAPGNGGTIPATNGGGGAGGVIFIQARNVAATIGIDVKGGATGICATLPAADGMKTMTVDDPTFCVDADQDTHKSASCGGDDCDDSDKSINPDAKEVCNDVDDNCDGTNNEGADLCSAGRTCDATSKTCVDISDAGTDAGPAVDAGAPPDHIAFESGCSLGGDGGSLGAIATATATLGAFALVTRRRRALRSPKGRG